MGYDWSIFDACCTSEHLFFSGFEVEKGLRVIHACVVYTPFYGIDWIYTKFHRNVPEIEVKNFSSPLQKNQACGAIQVLKRL